MHEYMRGRASCQAYQQCIIPWHIAMHVSLRGHDQHCDSYTSNLPYTRELLSGPAMQCRLRQATVNTLLRATVVGGFICH